LPECLLKSFAKNSGSDFETDEKKPRYGLSKSINFLKEKSVEKKESGKMKKRKNERV